MPATRLTSDRRKRKTASCSLELRPKTSCIFFLISFDNDWRARALASCPRESLPFFSANFHALNQMIFQCRHDNRNGICIVNALKDFQAVVEGMLKFCPQ